MFEQNWENDKWKVHFLVGLYDEPCLVACLNKI